jgi:hypothetical protein
MRVSTIVVLEEDGAYPMILGRPSLTKSHVRNYWGEGYMTIGIHPNRQKVPFANFVKSFGGTSEYDDESEIDQSSKSEEIYTDDSSERGSRVISFGSNTQGWNFVSGGSKNLKG